MKRTGFTLIELLVVLAIVALLSGMVYAALGGSREKGRQNVCIANLHHLNAGLHMYLSDYEAEDNALLMAHIPIDTKFALMKMGNLRCPDQHATMQEPAKDYLFNIGDEPPFSGEPSFLQTFQTCGAATVIFADDNHNFQDPNQPPRRSLFWLLGRYDGSISAGYYNATTSVSSTNPCFHK